VNCFICGSVENALSIVMMLSKSPNRTWCLQNLSTTLHRLQRIHHEPVSNQPPALPVDLHYSNQAQVGNQPPALPVELQYSNQAQVGNQPPVIPVVIIIFIIKQLLTQHMSVKNKLTNRICRLATAVSDGKIC